MGLCRLGRINMKIVKTCLALLFSCLGLALLTGCDQQKIAELTPGQASRAEVEAKWGQPEAVWDGPNGEQILEYNRQPEGKRNWQVVLGADGKLLRTEQVLNARNFATIDPGMPMEDVRRQLGKPARQIPYTLKNEVHWEYRYLGDNGVDEMLFTVVFEPQSMAVKSASGGPDPHGRGGVLRNNH